MDELLKSLAATLGISLTNATLLVGVVVGFIIRSVIGSKSNNPTTGTKSQSRPSSNSSAFSSNASIQFSTIGGGSAQQSQLALNDSQIQEIREFLRKGDKIGAIKRFREISNLGLAEAKSVIDALEGKII